MENLIALLAFVVFGALWIAFAAALVASQGSLDATWEWIRSLPLVVQIVLWLLFLPVVIGLWAWETDWPVAARLLVVAGLAVWTLYMFLPRWLWEGRS
jgi:ABC-type amino acid transport system permease subunit